MMAMMRSALLRRSGAARTPAGNRHLFTDQGPEKLADLPITLLRKLKWVGKEIYERFWEPLIPAQKMISLSWMAGVAYMADRDRQSSAHLAEVEAAHAARNGKK